MDMESLNLNGTVSNIDDEINLNGNHIVDEVMDMVDDSMSSPEPVAEDAAPTYADAFPPLSSVSSAPQPSWGPPKSAKKTHTVTKYSTTSQMIKIPYEERKFKGNTGIPANGTQSDAIRDIMHKTGTKIEVSYTKDQSLTVVVTGRLDVIDKARAQIISQLQTTASIEMSIPREFHGKIIGKKGVELKEIERVSAAKVTIPRDSDIVRIVGTKEGIDIARHRLQQIADEQSKLARETLNIPKIYHPFIFGPFQETYQNILKITGAKINIPPLSIDQNVIVVNGEKEGVQRAVKMINEIFEEKKKQCNTVSIEVKKSQHKYVYGQRGAGLQEILRDTGVSVEMPSADTPDETITLRGDGDKLGNALTLVYEKANSKISKEIHAPEWLHRFIIGRKGQNIKKITEDLKDVQIEIDAKHGDKIVISGPPNEVKIAENLLELSLKELTNTMSFVEVDIDHKLHRHIIGKNGIHINKIKNDTGTSINIPKDTDKSNIIRIEGSPDGIKAARAQILEISKKVENEKSRDIIIDYKYHKNIIGQKGDKVKEIREKFPTVNISFPDASKQNNVVTLRGPRVDVDKCYDFLKKLVTEITASNFRLEVPVFKQFHGNVIGKQGASIKKIKEETDTQIDIPASNSNSDIIVIIGYKDKCEKAKKMILAIQNDLAKIEMKEVRIDQKFHTSMIGAGGKLIQSIMTECGNVHIKFPAEGEKSDIITLRGTKEDVAKAEVQIKKLAEERQEKSFTAEVPAKPEHHRFLIGRGGVNIRKLREKYDVRIMFPTKEDNQEIITIMGKQDAVASAKEDLMAKVRDLNNIVEDEIQIDPKYHKHLIAKRAQVLRDIADDFGGVAVSLPKDPESSTVSIKGAKDCVEGAKNFLVKLVDELESMVEEECHILQKHHRAILGAKGRNVQELTSKYNVQIKFPDRRKNEEQEKVEEEVEVENEKNNIIMVSGNREQVKIVKEALLALVPVKKEVSIPFENHKFIIKQKGDGIKELMKQFDVNIAIPPADKESCIIVVTGPAERVDKAIEALEERNVEIEAESEERKLRNFELTVDVQNKHHFKFMEKKMALKTSLAEKLDVRIFVPKRDTPLEDPRAHQLHIVGYEKNCEFAKITILELIKEWESYANIEVRIDPRIHSRIIGQKGRNVRKLMDKFKVEIHFPRSSGKPDDVLDVITITGIEDDCENCKEHLLMLEEEMLDEVGERYSAPKRETISSREQNQPQGYVVANAPWTYGENPSDFPSLGGGPTAGQNKAAWGSWGR